MIFFIPFMCILSFFYIHIFIQGRVLQEQNADYI